MRLATVLTGSRTAWGVLDGRFGRGDTGVHRAPSLHDLTRRFDSPIELVQAACDDPDMVAKEASRVQPTQVDAFLPPIQRPSRILCVGVNYADHAAETGRPTEPQPYPTIFTRFASSLVGQGEPIEVPAASERLDYEGELAVVIGRAGRNIDAADALTHVAGYSCFLDGSVRDYQRHTSQFTPGKNFDRSGAWGPWITTTEEIDDPSALQLTTSVNGEVLQDAPTSDLIHDVGAVIEYVSTFTTLEPGDVIATGTPGGVGAARTPPRWLVPGDIVEVNITGIGALNSPVVAGT